MIKKFLGIFSIIILFSILIACGNKNTEDKSDINDIKVNEINELIEKLPENIDINIETDIYKIIYLYDSLPNIYKDKVNSYQKVLEAKELINKLKEEQILKDLANIIINKINGLPSIDSIKLSDKEEVLNVKSEYDKLEINVKQLVTNYGVLESLIEQLNKLQEELDQEEYYKQLANEVVILISNLPSVDNISLTDKQTIINVRNAYNDLAVEAKVYVSNLNKLEIVESKLNELEQAFSDAKIFNDLINTLPDVSNLKITNKTDVVNARNIYNNLSELAKTYVTNLEKLIALEERLIELQNEEESSILDCISDVATSTTVDTLILENDKATFTWSSSNKNLYVINGNEARVNIAYQKHQFQKVIVYVKINYQNGTSKTLSKEITVSPVLFNDLPSTPVATYFASESYSSYKTYSTRYQTEKTTFSIKAKNVLDIVYYAFAIPRSDGTIYIENMTTFNEVIKIRESGIRVVLSIKGVNKETFDAFNTITKDDNLINTFVTNIMDLIDKNYLDGVDLDWESVSESQKVNAAQMNKLVKALRAEMNKRQEENGSNYLLTAAIPGTSWGAGSDRFDFTTLNNYLDYVNMMSYDSNKEYITSHLAPLYKSSNDNGYGFGVDYATNLFASKGLSKSKIIIGAAGYGKLYKITGTINASATYPALGISGELTSVSGIAGSFDSGTLYGNAVVTLMNNSNYKKYTEYNSSGKIVGTYLYSQVDQIFVTYEGSETVLAKYNYAKSYTGMGIMCWAYTEDTSDTYVNTIYDAIN